MATSPTYYVEPILIATLRATPIVLIAEIVLLQAKARDLSAWIKWAAPIDDPETRRMLDWARRRLASIERAVNPGRFGDWLREKKLFPEVDPMTR